MDNSRADFRVKVDDLHCSILSIDGKPLEGSSPVVEIFGLGEKNKSILERIKPNNPLEHASLSLIQYQINKLAALLDSQDDNTNTAKVMDVSLGGIMLSSSISIQEHSTLEIYLPIDSSGANLTNGSRNITQFRGGMSLKLRVLRSFCKDGEHFAGGNFLDLTTSHSKILNEFIQKQPLSNHI